MSSTRPEPHSIENEQAVLGSLLIERDAIISVAPLLTAGDFYRSDHQQLYRAIRQLYDRRIPADLLTVQSELERMGAQCRDSAMTYMLELMNYVPTAVHAPYYAAEVHKSAVQRRYIEAGKTIVRLAWQNNVDVDELMVHASEALSKATVSGVTQDYVSLSEAVSLMWDDLNNEKRAARAVRSGYHRLDRQIGGFYPGQEIVIGARPGVGKSAFGIQLAYQISIKEGRPAGFISLEMSETAIVERLVAIVSQVNMHDYKNQARTDWQEQRVTDAAGVVSNGKLQIVRKRNGSLATVLAQARDLHARYGIECLIVDYLQLMTGSRRENRTQDVSEISRGLKLLAMELEIPVIALSQLNRDIEHRGADAVPKLSDLRESGSIEQDADIVIFPHRQILTSKLQPAQQEASFVIAKHREGPGGFCDMWWKPATAQFVDRDTIHHLSAAD